MTNSDPDLVDYEMDVYWVVTAGHDPVEWLNKYPGRWKLMHVRDRYRDEKVAELKAQAEANGEEEGDWPIKASCVLGTGKINFPRVLGVAKDVGVELFHVEQERYDGMTSMEAARRNAQFMDQVKLM